MGKYFILLLCTIDSGSSIQAKHRILIKVNIHGLSDMKILKFQYTAILLILSSSALWSLTHTGAVYTDS